MATKEPMTQGEKMINATLHCEWLDLCTPFDLEDVLQTLHDEDIQSMLDPRMEVIDRDGMDYDIAHALIILERPNVIAIEIVEFCEGHDTAYYEVTLDDDDERASLRAWVKAHRPYLLLPKARA